jgi:hypothetical protein
LETIIIVLKQYNCSIVEFENCYRVNGILEVFKDSLQIENLKNKKTKTFKNEDLRILYCLDIIQKQPKKSTFYYRKAEIVPKINPRYKMPFGKYKGQLLSDIPKNYLIWLTSQEKLPRQIELYLETI